MPSMDLDRSLARDFTRRYALALGLVALLTIAAQGLVQLALHRAQTDATVINLAGRQRMLSQRLCKAALARREEVAQVLAEWMAAHRRLSSGSDLPNAGAANSPVVAAIFAEIAPPFQAMQEAALALPLDPTATARLLAHEQAFLAGMERIVGTYRDEAESRVTRLIGLELGLCVLLLVVLAIEAVVVFRPAVRRLRQATFERERLHRQELDNRALTVAADVARGIGMDLHDGLGQTLTALSFQAQTLQRQLAGHPATEQVQALGRGIAEAIAQTRAQARRLSPVDIQVAGLEVALRELTSAITGATGTICRLDWPTGAAPPASAGEDLYRICQEAVTNALRHGRAKTISISVSAEAVRIRDDGHNGSTGADGVGLRSMREHASRIGARLVAGPDPAGGWLVSVYLGASPAMTGADRLQPHAG